MKQQHGINILALLCLIACIVFNGCSSLRTREASENESVKNIEQPEALNTPVSRGYLADGATVKVETETDRVEGTIIEQFEKTSLELKRTKERLSSLENEFKKQKSLEESLQEELTDSKEKLATAQLLLIENENLNSEIARLKKFLPALQEQIKQLNEKLLEAQISEIKIKQELVNTRLQHLQEQKKLPKKDEPTEQQ